jgi:hypothetical protein
MDAGANAMQTTPEQISRLSVKELMAIESRLNRSFYAAVIAVIISIVLNAYLIAPLLREPRENVALIALAVSIGTLLALGGYIWYVVSIYATAKAMRKPFGLYLFWAIGGPILSLIPIPIVSRILSVTPLTIKFLLSGEIRTMIRLQTLRDLH